MKRIYLLDGIAKSRSKDMAKDVEFKLNLLGLNDLMKSKPMQDSLLEAGQTVANIAGEGYAAEVHVANFIAISNVYPDSKEAAKENYEDNTLLKALGSSGLSMVK